MADTVLLRLIKKMCVLKEFVDKGRLFFCMVVFSPGCLRISGHYPFQSESISATIPSNLKAYRLTKCSLFCIS